MILSLLLSVAPIAEAATKADVTAVLNYMYCRVESLRGCTKPISPSWSDGSLPIKRLVVVYDGKRYTLSHIGAYQDDPEMFEIYERIDGAKGRRCWQDGRLDGVEDHGDQKQYDAAITAVLKYFRTPPEPVTAEPSSEAVAPAANPSP